MKKYLHFLLLLPVLPAAYLLQPQIPKDVETKALTIEASPSIEQPKPKECGPLSPVKKEIINQSFGVVPNPKTLNKSKHFHSGIDFDGAVGSPVTSVTCGTVIYSGRVKNPNHWSWGYGEHIQIRDPQGRVHLYAHLFKRAVKVGQEVEAGQFIGEIGLSGNTSGPHLHYEVRKKGEPPKTEAELQEATLNPQEVLNTPIISTP